jgi:hypothetical protein
MTKSLALETFLSPVFSKIKTQSAKKSSGNTFRFYVASGLIVANLVLVMAYVYGVNRVASQGYEMKALQKRLAVLTEENKKISLKVAEAGSMVSIQSGFLSANFVPAGNLKFLQVPPPAQFTQR